MAKKLPPFPKAEYDLAVRGEQEDRYFSFLETGEKICGIPVKPLTLRILAWLTICRSPFIVGGKISMTAIVKFLWLVSPKFCDSKYKRDRFVKSIMPLDWDKALKDIDDYVERAFLDCVGGSAGGLILASTCATVCFQMSDEPFRMNWRETMDTPLGVLFQLLKVKGLRDGTAPKTNKRSERVAAKWLAERNRIRKLNEKPKKKGMKNG